MPLSNINIPNILTISRLVLSITILPFLIVYFNIYDSLSYNIFITIFFILISLTDMFDGYLARKYNNETIFGALLDPIADKFLLSSSLISLAYIHKVHFFIVILLISREFFVMGLRQISLRYNVVISVIKLAKYKTAIQFLYITLLLFIPFFYINNFFINIIELLVIALSISSAYKYYIYFANNIRNVEMKK